jgi:hypothetical protein
MTEETTALEPLEPRDLENVDTICYLLRCNDPRLTELDLENFVLMSEETGRIGDALLENTIVEGIKADLDAFFDENDYPEQPIARAELDCLTKKVTAVANPFLRYICDSSILQRIKLRALSFDYLEPLGEHLLGLFYKAVANNPHQPLQDMEIIAWECTEQYPAKFSRFLAAMQSLKRLTILVNHPVNNSLRWLEEALCSNSSLNYLSLIMRGDTTVDGLAFLRVILQSGVHLRLHELHFSLDMNSNTEFPKLWQRYWVPQENCRLYG